MTRRMYVHGLLMFAIGSLSAAYACSPFFPLTFLGDGFEWRILTLPDASFRWEAGRVLEVDLFYKNGHYRSERQFAAPLSKGDAAYWKSTLEADETDLQEALAAKSLQGTVSMSQYRAYRTAVKTTPNMLQAFSEAFVLQSLPKEFALYCQGARAYRWGNLESATRDWHTLLELPPDERQYRSTWAAYMIAKARLKTDPEGAIEYYAKVRELADAGFRDTLGLAQDSFGLQAQAELRAGMHAQAIQHYARLLLTSDETNREVWGESLQSACYAACHAERIDPNATKDSLCQQLVAAYLISNPDATSISARWSEALREAGVQKPYPGADRLAWAAYNCGDMENVRRWTDAADPASPYTKWVQSKLLLRDGKIDKAIALLHTLVDAFPREDRWPASIPRELPATPGNSSPRGIDDYILRNPASPRDEVKADLGVLLVGRGEYSKALDLFAKSHFSEDTAYIAERVLTITELREYVDSHANDPALQEPLENHYYDEISRIAYLSDILARRMVRAGQWKDAMKYLAKDGQERLNPIMSALEVAAQVSPVRWGDTQLRFPSKEAKKPSKDSGSDRATHLVAAARMFQKEEHSKLLRTELEPDWGYYNGGFELTGPTYHRAFKAGMTPTLSWMVEEPMKKNLVQLEDKEVFKTLPASTIKALDASDDEVRRVWKSAPTYNLRRSYLYLLAELYWQAAQSLPDNDMETLKVLYEGGMLLKNRNPRAADRFYKAIVRRCPALPYAQEADKRHWFPKYAPGEEPEEQLQLPAVQSQ
ncbi:MAG: hypothetical protein K1Y02_16365 [Candidatus Hydrogenedentes bacterium]|nr:hypothetical protein [Candidatus Hydrogenedentota bacterium]